MKSKLLISFLLVVMPLVRNELLAQGAGIGTTSPHPSAALHVLEKDNNRGVLIPRFEPNLSDVSKVDGLLVYNTNTGNLAYSKDGTWTEIVPVPSGTVIMWSFSQGAIPEGWVLCDGRKYDLQGNSVGSGVGILAPDLRGQFVAGYSGAGDYASVGPSGKGSKTHQLTVAEMPAHNHTVSDPGHSHSVSISASHHSHNFTVSDALKEDIGLFPNSGAATFPGIYYTPALGEKTSGSVVTGVTVNSESTGVATGQTGSGQPHENRPPYYVLAFIMKL